MLWLKITTVPVVLGALGMIKKVVDKHIKRRLTAVANKKYPPKNNK